jgi:hypothetical protein
VSISPPQRDVIAGLNSKVTYQFWPIIGGIMLDFYGVNIVTLACTSLICAGAVVAGEFVRQDWRSGTATQIDPVRSPGCEHRHLAHVSRRSCKASPHYSPQIASLPATLSFSDYDGFRNRRTGLGSTQTILSLVRRLWTRSGFRIGIGRCKGREAGFRNDHHPDQEQHRVVWVSCKKILCCSNYF